MVISMVACGTESAESLDEFIVLGTQYLLDGNYEEAVVAFDKAINVDGKCIIAYVGKADANLGLENYPEAESVFSKIIEIDEAFQYYILFEYDANGNVTKETSYNADGTLDMSWLE